jgi:hypothetical protein
MKRLILSMIAVFAIPASAFGFININICCSMRTQQYPIGKYSNIYVVSPHSSGSTLLFNVLRILFENQRNSPDDPLHQLVDKMHELSLMKRNALYFSTVRNPLDICYSKYRIDCGRAQKRLPLSHIKSIVEEEVECFKLIDSLKQQNANLIELKYEDFVNNLDYLFNTIEKHFSFVIDESDKSLIKEAMSKKNVMENIRELADSSVYFLESYFHGHHIDQGEFSKEDQVMIKKEIVADLKEYQLIFEKFGYACE